MYTYTSTYTLLIPYLSVHMDIHADMQHEQGRGHASWTWTYRTYSMIQDTLHGFGHAAWTCSCSMDLGNGCAWMPECR